MNKASDRDPLYDIVKGIAILAVVLTHTYTLKTEFDNRLLLIYKQFLAPAVPVFFVMSGALVNQSKAIEHPITWIKKRSIRLVLPFAFWATVFVAMNCVAVKGFSNVINAYLKILRGGNLLYFIIVLFEFTLITPLLIKLNKSKVRAVGYLLTPAYSIIRTAYYLNTNVANALNPVVPILFSEINGISLISYYCIGLCFKKLLVSEKIKGKKNIIWIAFFVFWIATYLEGIYLNQRVSISPAVSCLRIFIYPLTICIILLIVAYADKIRGLLGGNRPIVWMGMNSMPIYYLHTIVFYISDFIVRNILGVFSSIEIINNIITQSVLNTLIILPICFVIVVLARKVFAKNVLCLKIIGFN